MTAVTSLHRRLARVGPGLYRWSGPELAGTIVAALVSQGRRAVLVAATASKAEVIDALAAAYRFPPGTGRNWDALADLLADHASGTVLVLDASALATAASSDWDTLRSVLADTAAWFAPSPDGFSVIVLGAGDDLPRA